MLWETRPGELAESVIRFSTMQHMPGNMAIDDRYYFTDTAMELRVYARLDRRTLRPGDTALDILVYEDSRTATA